MPTTDRHWYRASSGTYRMVLTLSGDTGLFSTESSRVIVVQSQYSPPPPPRLVSVQFADNGVTAIATFSGPTDRGTITDDIWPCNKIFEFTVSVCSGLSIDISGSTGNAGRQWKSIVWNILDVRVQDKTVVDIPQLGMEKAVATSSSTIAVMLSQWWISATDNPVIRAVITGGTAVKAMWSVSQFSQTVDYAQFPVRIQGQQYTPGCSFVFRVSVYPIPGNGNGNGNPVSGAVFEDIVLRVRYPPSSGVLIVNPVKGTELMTNFRFSASLWVADEDQYPLRYQIVYRQIDSDTVPGFVLLSLSELSSLTTQLPGGLASQNYLIYCYMDVVDTSGSKTTVSVSLTVEPLDIIRGGGSDGKLDSILMNITYDIGDVNSLLRTVNVYSSLINRYSGVPGPYNGQCRKVDDNSQQSDLCVTGYDCQQHVRLPSKNIDMTMRFDSSTTLHHSELSARGVGGSLIRLPSTGLE
eukprot:gene11056-biopygen5359